MLPSAIAMALVFAVLASLVILICHLPWRCSLLFAFGHSRRASSQVLRVVADAVEDGNPVDEALTDQLMDLPLIYRLRLHSFRRRLDGGEDLVEALGRSRLLPKRLASLLERARNDGGATLAGCCRALATALGNPPSGQLQRLWWWWLLLLPVFHLLAFLASIILPRFEQIFAEMGVDLPFFTALLIQGFGSSFSIFGLLILAAITAPWWLGALAWLKHSRSPIPQRVGRSLLLLEGSSLGLPESRLAHLLAVPSGDFASISRAAGIPASSPGQLAARLESLRWRRQRIERLLMLLLDLGIPVLLGLFGGFVALAIFQPFIVILELL